jgi:hypothetical protein
MTENQFDITKIDEGDTILFDDKEYTIFEIDREKRMVRTNIDGFDFWIECESFELKNE